MSEDRSPLEEEETEERSRWRRLDALVQRALAVPQEELEDFLDRECGDDSELRREVEALLSADREASGSFLRPYPGLTELGVPLAAGRRIGPYRVLRSLDGGGMSRVMVAERAEGDFDQRVVIKMLPLAFHEASWVERFRREQAILGRLRHPAIARILDGGVTDGQPYFVLEYIDGVRIDRACREQGLGLEHRLDLVAKICDAVHFAHQRFVVHRDLKPSNILVDGNGEPRLLDFGVAKILGDHRPDLTETGGSMMTPQYAAPEQIENGPITTATDVYSLGVLLYELLTGKRPYDLSDVSLGVLEERICRRDPPPPSRAVGSDLADAPWAEELPNLHLRAQALRGDLDAVLLQALAKEPEKRYPSCAELAADLRAHLAFRPVTARRRTPAYRLRKWLRRRRVAVRFGAVLATVAALLGLLFLHQAEELADERRRADQEHRQGRQMSAFLLELVEASDPERARGETLTVLDVLERSASRVEALGSDPRMQAELRESLAKVYAGLGRYPDARDHLVLALDFYRAEAPRSAAAARISGALADVYATLAEHGPAEELAAGALELQRQLSGPGSPETVELLDVLGSVRSAQGDFSGARELWSEALAVARAHAQGPTSAMAFLTQQVAFADSELQHYERALGGQRRALLLFQLAEGDDHPAVATVLHDLAGCAGSLGRIDEAIAYGRRSLELRRHQLGEQHPKTLKTLTNLAVTLSNAGRFEEAEPLLRRALDSRIAVWGEQHPQVVAGTVALAWALEHLGQEAEAERLYRRALDIARTAFPASHPFRTYPHTYLASLLYRRGDLREAEALIREALSARLASLEGDHSRIGEAHLHLGACLRRAGRSKEAAEHLGEARRILAGHPEGRLHQLLQEELAALGLAPPTI